MAQINIQPTRPKENTKLTLNEDICLIDTTGAEVTNAEAVSATELALPLVIESLPSDIYGADGSLTLDSPGGVGSTIVLTNVSPAFFTDVRIGDLVFGINVTANQWNAGGAEDDPTQDTAGDEDFTAGQGNAFAVGAYVSAVDPGLQTVDVTVGAGNVLVDATARTGAEIAFRRNGIKVTLAHIGVQVTTVGDNISLAPILYIQDGTAAIEGATQDSYDGLLTTSPTATAVTFTAQTIQYDAFLSNARVARSDT